MKLLITAAIVGVMILVAGCGNNVNNSHAYLSVMLQNSSSEPLDEAEVTFGQYRCTVGFLGPGDYKADNDWRPPVGTNAVVQWRDSKQVKHAVPVSLAGIYDPTVEGRLIFSIGPTNVTVNSSRGEARGCCNH